MSPLIDKPAILGGTPAFEKTIPITQPTIPSLNELQKPFSEILASGQITNGKYVKKFEEKAADYFGAKYALAVSSCTLGLVLTEQALGLTGEVIVPSFTFCATAHSLLWNNLTPIFVDCELESHNIDPRLIEPLITPKTSAILAVDVFGNPSDREALQAITKKHNLKLIIDAAHSFGALYQGKQLAGYADAQVFSLSPTKLVVAGEGGLIITDDQKLAQRLKLARNYGSPENYDCEFAGLNARMMEMNAILGLKSLEKIEENVTRRNKLVELYKNNLAQLLGISFQKIEPLSRSSYKDFSILIDEKEFGLNRDQLALALKKENIETRPYFYPPIHRMKAYQNFKKTYEGKLPNTEYLACHALSLPLSSHISEGAINDIYQAIRHIHIFANEIEAIT